MSQYNEKGLMMDNWHKCPNALVDKLMGDVLSPNATCVVLTILRLTDGIRGRAEASIPTEKFMTILDTNREKTVYKYVDEAIQSGLISVKKSRGKVSVYSINKKCTLWYDVEVVAENVPTLHEKEVVAESATTGEKRHTVGAENATTHPQSSGEKRHTYKDIKIKDNNKDIKINSELEETETEVESTDAKSDTENTKPPAKKKPAKKPMTEFSDDFTATEKQIEKCNEYGINVAELIEEMADNKRSNSISHACWTSAFNTWIRNHIKFNRLKPVTHTATSHQTAKTSYRKTPDPLAVNAKWNVQTQMTEEEKRQWLSGDVDSDIPSAFLSDNNRNYG